MDDRISPAVEELASALEELGSGHLVTVTGAGISLASGIPTFRGDDPGAVWKRDITELGTRAFFERDPVASWRWTHEVFAQVPGAQPNAGHRALAVLEGWHRGRGGRATLVTQNVDCLHESAGSPDVIKVHGSVDRLRCASDRGCRHGAPSGSLARESVDFGPFLADPSLGNLPRCPACGQLLRQHVLWFDEFYADHDDYQWPRVQEAASTGELFLFVGTSFAVGVTELFLQAAGLLSAPVFSVDPSGERPYPGVTALPLRAEELLPAVCRWLDLELE